MSSLPTRLVACLAGGILATACSLNSALPTAPSGDLFEGIVVYEHADFGGQSANITSDISDLKGWAGPCRYLEAGAGPLPYIDHSWNDCISSVRVAPGWVAWLYRGPSFRDDSIEVTEDMSSLSDAPHDCDRGGLNDCVSSILVRRLPMAFSGELVEGMVAYEHENFLGESIHITTDIGDLTKFAGPCGRGSRSGWADCISSVRVAPGWYATLYRGDHFRDDAITLTADLPSLKGLRHDCPSGGLNDCISSVQVGRR